MKIASKKITIKLIDGSIYECECASLSAISLSHIIDELFKQKLLLSDGFGTDNLCDECPLLNCCAHRMYMGIRNGIVIKNPKASMFEIGIREDDTINIVPHVPCTYFMHSQILFTSELPRILKFRIKNFDGRYFDWAIDSGSLEGQFNIKWLFDDLVRSNVLPKNSELKKYYGSEFSKYGVLLQNGTSFSQDCELTLQELGFKSGDEIWLGLIPAIYVPKDINDLVNGIVVTK